MFKALVKSRLQATMAALFHSGKKGKRRSRAGVIGYGLLMLYAACCFVLLFLMMAAQLCGPLLAAGLGWLYFALMGTMATALAVVGSVFAAQTQLFEAKDNEMLLAMPIPPACLLGSRMLALYVQNLLLEFLVLLPSAVVYFRKIPLSVQSGVFFGLILFLLPLLALTLSCLLGWLVALISSRMRNKSLITVILSLAFLALYFYGYSKVNTYLQLLILNSEAVGAAVRRVLFPLYQMGMAAQGDALAFVWFLLCVILPFAVMYWILSRSFVKIATTKRGAAKVRYREKTLAVSSPERALLQKELRHFWASPMYMLNGALGSVLLLIGAVVALVKRGWVLSLLVMMPGLFTWAPLLACAAVCMIVGTNIITAPSVSLEGKAIWLLQSMPLTGWQALQSKLRMNLWITALPAAICALSLTVVLQPTLPAALMMVGIPILFSMLCGALGLCVNLLMPRLDWVSETAAVKQSGSSILTMFADWGVVLLLGALFLALRKVLSMEWFLLICMVLIAAAVWILYRWLRKKGVMIFESLHG